MKSIVLASTSPWRLALLRDAGIRCECAAPDVDESRIDAPTPELLAVARARAKALAVAQTHTEALVIGADQVAHLDGATFGKPEDDARWLARLSALRGRAHLLSTGVVIVEGRHVEEFVVTTGVRFRADLRDKELLAYVRWGEARGCAGGYQAERLGAWLIEAVDGDWWNVIGLPIYPLITRLRARGITLDNIIDEAAVAGLG